MIEIETHSQEEQEQLGARLSAAVGDVCTCYLYGDLGTGKTTLVRGFLRGLGHQGSVKSPTYTLMEPYQVGGRAVYHFDLYRLADPGELEYLGVRDLLEQESVILVEWPERGVGELPPADLVVDIQYLAHGRALRIKAQNKSGEAILARLGKQTGERAP